MNIALGAPEAAARTCVDERWVDDARLLGFGRGETGLERAAEGLLLALGAHTPNFKLLGVYGDGTPVGLIWVEYLGDVTKTAKLHILMAPKVRGKGAFQKAGRLILDTLFGGGIYRIEAEPLKINKRCIKLLRHYGFKQEAVKRSSLWMDGNDYDQVLLRLLRREYKKETR